MIKLAVITRDENYLQQLTNRLTRDKDISLISSILIKNFENEMERTLAFMKQLIEQKPDIFLFEQGILRDAAALNLGIILDYRNKLPAMRTIIVGIRFNEENVMAMMQGGVRGFFRFAQSDSNLLNVFTWWHGERSGSKLS